MRDKLDGLEGRPLGHNRRNVYSLMPIVDGETRVHLAGKLEGTDESSLYVPQLEIGLV